MSTNRVSATLSKEDRDAIFHALATIRERLPFLIELSAAERKNLTRLGDKSLAFVSKALELAQQNPGFLPRDFDIEEMADDFELYQSLGSILMSLRKLTEEIEDTQDAAGGEAFSKPSARWLKNGIEDALRMSLTTKLF